MNKEQIIEMIRDNNTPKELIVAQFETAFKYQMDLQKTIDVLHNNQNKLIDEIGEKDKEITRLNNIIEEIQHKAYLGMKENENKTNEFQQAFTVAYRYIYNEINKLKELKEGK